MSAASCTSEYVTNQNWQSHSDPHEIFNFSNRAITGFGIKKLQTQFKLKDSRNIYYDNFEL